jgi:hypothetical protein
LSVADGSYAGERGSGSQKMLFAVCIAEFYTNILGVIISIGGMLIAGLTNGSNHALICALILQRKR